MRTVYLHVGLPKTGTSSLQHSFAAARDPLLRHYGLYVPDAALNVSAAVRHLVAEGPSKTARRTNAKEGERLREEIISMTSDLFLSGEGLWALSTEEIARLRDLLGEHRLVVIFVVREPVRHTVSLVQQFLKTGSTLAQLHDRPPILNWPQGVRVYRDAVAPDAFHGVAFEDVCAHPQGLVGWFLEAAGVPPARAFEEGHIVEMQTNPSMSMEGAVLLSEVNRLVGIDDAHQRARQHARTRLFRNLLALPGSRFGVPDPVKRKIYDSTRPHAQFARDELGIGAYADERPPAGESPALPAMTEATLSALAKVMVDEVGRGAKS